MRFVGRERDLQLLRDQYDAVAASGDGAFVSIRGRRRVGKSTLIERFLRRDAPPHVFFAASRQRLDRELELFLGELASSSLRAGASLRAGLTPNSWEAALTLLAQTAERSRPAVVVLDEFPWLVEQDPSIEAVFQKAWDRGLRHAPVLLIVVGSDLAMMESLTSYGRPLYGRPTREMVVDPLTPSEIAELLDVAAVDALDAYTVIGGFPQLALSWPRGVSRSTFLEHALQDEHSPLIVSGERALAAEFPPQTSPRAVFSAIGAGEAAFSRIAARAEIGASQLSAILTALEEKRAIRKLIPFGAGRSSRATRYVVTDPYLRFWLRFVEPNMQLIERGRGSVAAERVEAAWADYRGKAIEPIVRSAIERLLPDPRFADARHVSGYWTRDNRVEIDLVGSREPSGAAKRATFAGSIEWRERQPFRSADARALAAHRERLPLSDARTLLVAASRSGFERGLDVDVQLDPEAIVDAWR